MNEQTTKLLETLAQKLGTTTEYLWSVLLKQAPIDATITLIQTLLIALFGFILYRTHKRFLKVVETEYSRYTIYSKYEEGAAIPMIIAFVLFLIFSCCAFLDINDIVNGYFNPEYWALDKIMNTMKQ